jgi:hypothetical protein
MLLATALLLAGCGGIASEQTVAGEIDDTEIRLDAGSAAPNVWVELENVGSRPCALVPILAPDPEGIPVENGRAVMSLSGDPSLPAPLEAYVELNGEAVDRGDGLMTETGWVTTVAPGDTVRLQLAFSGIPDGGERVLACNDDGGYAAGRFAFLRFER